MDLAEVLVVCERLFAEAQIDFLDMSLWDVFKDPMDEAFKGRSLLSYFTALPRGEVRLGMPARSAHQRTRSARLRRVLTG